MQQFSEDNHYLIIHSLNLFPELSNDPIVMYEQIMNALILINDSNIQIAVEAIVLLQTIYGDKSILFSDIASQLAQLKLFLNGYKLDYCLGEEVRAYYPNYHNKLHNYSEIGKQAAINMDFALRKKVSFDGHKIKFEDSFFHMVLQILHKQRETEKYNPDDKLLFNIIEPLTMNNHVATLNTIKKEVIGFKNSFLEFCTNGNLSERLINE